MYSLRSKLMRINSKERDMILSASSSDMVIKFDANNPTISQIHSIVFKSCSIPNAQPNIDSTNNTFIFMSGGNSYSINILGGNYNITNLISTLTSSPNAIAVGMAIVVDPISRRLEFSFTTNSTILTLAQGNKMATILGITTSSNIDVATFLAGGLPNLIGLENVYIACTELSGGDYLIDSALGQLNVFNNVQITVPFGTIQHYSSNDQDLDTILFPADRTLDNLTIKLYDDRGRIIDLQGLNWQMCLKIWFHTNSTN